MTIYVHAGNNRTVRARDIVGIFDMDTATMAPSTRDFLKKAERDGRVITVKEDIPKSFIVTKPPKDAMEPDRVYISQISAYALSGRTK